VWRWLGHGGACEDEGAAVTQRVADATFLARRMARVGRENAAMSDLDAMPQPRPGDALIIVDVQCDFLPGGALAVAQGDRVVDPLHRLAAAMHDQGLPVFATRDWHPEVHCSFRAQGGPWPPHCVAGTPGASFPAALGLPAGTNIVSKAEQRDRDAYSGFAGTELESRLRAAGVQRVFVGGLATDYCVLQTVLDARRLGFDVVVLTDAVAAVDVQAGDGDAALVQMREAGAMLVASRMR
jgi:nicotinamidase/pyrazinamidase